VALRFAQDFVADCPCGFAGGRSAATPPLFMTAAVLITPKKKNQKTIKVLSKQNKERLKSRVVVEHVFCHLDRYRRLLVRFEHECKYFKGFHELVFIEMMKKYVM
jgi:hypothetical protein